MAGSIEYMEWYKFQFWRYVFVQDVVAQFAKSFIDFPPLQPPASFNLDEIKAKVARHLAHQAAA